MARAISKSAIAVSQVDVDEKLEYLMSAWEISSDAITQLAITPFGACRFLVTLLYTGGYIIKPILGLKPGVKYSLSLTAFKTSSGLKSAIVDIGGFKRSATSLFGLVMADFAKALEFFRPVTTLMGLVATVAAVFVERTPLFSAALGLFGAIERALGMSRAAGSPTVGLLPDIGFTQFRP